MNRIESFKYRKKKPNKSSKNSNELNIKWKGNTISNRKTLKTCLAFRIAWKMKWKKKKRRTYGDGELD